MSKIQNERTFYDLFGDSKPILKVRFDVNSNNETTEVEVQNLINQQIDNKGIEALKAKCSHTALEELIEFYSSYNGFILGRPVFPEEAIKTPVIRLLPVAELSEFTKLYQPNGDRAWVMDYNKSKSIYRAGSEWLAFAEIERGSACLTIFLEGENAGKVFLATPEPRLNILKPIAKSFNELLQRIAKDPAAFFRLLGAHITIVGKDSQNFGYSPVEYIDGGGITNPEKGERITLNLLKNQKDEPVSKNDGDKNWWKFW